MDAGEHQEGSCREADHVQGAEGPSYFKFRGGVDYSRYGLDVEGQDGDGSSCQDHCTAGKEFCPVTPLKMNLYVMRQDYVAQIAGEVPEQVEFVPEALAPDFACPAVEEWYAGGNQKEQDEESFLTGTCLAQPR